jgi:hypothetical protein
MCYIRYKIIFHNTSDFIATFKAYDATYDVSPSAEIAVLQSRTKNLATPQAMQNQLLSVEIREIL